MKKKKVVIKKKYELLVLAFFLFCILLVIYYKPYYKIQDRVEEKEKFRYINKEKATGWLMVQGTNIDMAILNYQDYPDLSDPTYNIGWTHDESKVNDDRILIYSHNVRNVSSKPLIANKNHARFEQLMSFIYYDFAKKNEYIEYTSEKENNLYKIYAVYLIETDNIDENEGKLSDIQKKEYILNAKNRSYFKYDIDVNKKDKLITLATCTRFYGEDTSYSFVVEGRKLRKNEKVKKYRVTKDKKYDKIESVVKGEK